MRRKRRSQLKEYIRVGAAALDKEVLLSPALPRLVSQRPRKSVSEWLSIPTKSAKTRRIDFVKFVSLEAARVYRLELFHLGVKFSRLRSHEAGHVFLKEGVWYIEIDERYRWSDLSLSAIAAHEMAHVTLGIRHLSLQPTIRNEELTDTVAVLAGFGERMYAACLQERIANPLSLFIGFVSLERQRLGYLSRSEFSFLSRLKARIARGRPINRWCRIDPQTTSYIPCYACASKLRAPEREGRFIIRCPVCHMQQLVTLRIRSARARAFQNLLHYAVSAILTAADRLRGFEKVAV